MIEPAEHSPSVFDVRTVRRVTAYTVGERGHHKFCKPVPTRNKTVLDDRFIAIVQLLRMADYLYRGDGPDPNDTGL